jgi:Zn-finger nucleic acid-binding protein
MNGAASSVYVATVVSVQDELLPEFMTAACGGGTAGKATLRGMADVCLQTLPASALEGEAALEQLRDSDFSILLVRHLDFVTLEQIRRLVRTLPPAAAHHLHVVICRHQGETDYKISCPKCGQKLMVRDASAFRRAKCPHCQDIFMVPGQSDLIRNELILPANRLVRSVNLDDSATCRSALEAVIGQFREKVEAAKGTTMRLELPPEA